MKTIKSTLTFVLILYLCASLSGMPFVLSASAKITPKAMDGNTSLITIKKGDTLWDLAQEHLKNPMIWREFRKYNDFTNPDLIYPGETMRIPVKMAEVMKTDLEEKKTVIEGDLEKFMGQLSEVEMAQKSTAETIQELKKQLADLDAHHRALETALDKRFDAVNDAVMKSSKSTADALKKHSQMVEKQLAMISDQIGGLEKALAKHNDAVMEQQKQQQMLNSSIEVLAGKVDKFQTGIDEINKLLTEVEMEKPSGSKRALTMLATIAGGVAWVALHVIGDSY
jgi:LysM repeat protein